MSGQIQERRESDSEFKRFTEIVIAQNEAVNKIYLSQTESTRNALEGVIKSMDGLAASQAKLMDSQTMLVNAHIENKKDLEYINKRAERQEEELSQAMKELKLNSKTMILIEERTNNSANHWKTIGGIITSVISAGMIAAWISKP